MTKKEQTEQENPTPQELKAQADAILAAADQAEKEQKEKARNTPLDEKTIASLPAAALITANEKLRDLLALGLRGAEIGRALDFLLNEVVEGRLPNEQEALLAAVWGRDT